MTALSSSVRSGVVLATAIAIWSCGGRVEPAAPRIEVILPSGAEESAAVREALRAKFDRWATEAMRRPGAGFVVRGYGEGRDATRVLLALAVPDAWDPPVSASKAAFLADARRRIDGAFWGPTTPLADASGATNVVLLTSTGASRSWPASDGGDARDEAVVCDLSASTLGSACTVEAVEARYDRWVFGAVERPGSAFTVVVVGRSYDTAVVAFEIRSRGEDRGERLARLLGARAEIRRQVRRGESTGSAVAEALAVAIETLPKRSGNRTVFLLSDLRQTTRGTWDFEARVPDAGEFPRWLRSERLDVDLAGVEVVACGLHNRRRPGGAAFPRANAEAVERVWEEALVSLGAEVPDWTGDACGEATAIAER